MRSLLDGTGRVLFGAQSAEWITPLLQPYYRPVLALAAFTLLSSISGLLAPYLTKLVIDQALLKQDFSALVQYSIALFIIGLIALMSGIFNNYQHLRFSLRMLNGVRAALFQSVLQLSPRQHAKLRTGEVMSRLDGDAAELQKFAFDTLLAGGSAIVRLVGSIAFMLWLNWQLTLLVIALAPAELFFLVKVRAGTQARATEVREQRGRLAAFLNESVAAVPWLQALSAQKVRTQQMLGVQEQVAKALLAQQLWNETVNLFPALASAFGRLAILLVGGYWVIQGTMPLGSLIAFLSYLGFLLGPMRTLLGIYHAQARVKAAVARLDGLMLTKSDIPDRADGLSLQHTVGDLVAEQVSVHIQQKPVLSQYSVRLAAASKVLVRGASGTGKSTLCALWAGFLKPESGHIYYQGSDIHQVRLVDLRRAIVWLPQNAFLFHGSVRENFSLVNPSVSDEAIWQVLSYVRLADWVLELGGLDASLGERGLNISGGQRQRLAIARALLLPFQVIILDESLSEVDSITAQQVVANIDQHFPHTTRIFVAHGDEAIFSPYDQRIELGGV
ncbi:ABC transporter ATP-binding protein [Thiolinea disciformis]|uniref:ABC transporter ATP-binding protein n=1 Tax=Thiolinea disciformis TaxID=125614 RepID=UPI0003A32EDC|nr:ABC transporter ATP-binding protein [Thiolinea disciformis]